MSFQKNIWRARQRLGSFRLFGGLLNLNAQSNVTVRVMAANLNGDTQSYQPFAIRIFQGLKPDIVAIQEFNYSNNTASDFRAMVDTAFGTNFVYTASLTSAAVTSRTASSAVIDPFASGSWTDTVMSSPIAVMRGHRLICRAPTIFMLSACIVDQFGRQPCAEAANLKTLMQANFPSNAWIVVAGDFNTDAH